MKAALRLAATLILVIGGIMQSAAAQLKIDIPVVLKDAKVVFNMDHLAFAGELPIGLGYMKIMSAEFAANRTNWQIISIFHGAAGYMLLNDSAYARVRKTTTGNPYRETVAQLHKAG